MRQTHFVVGALLASLTALSSATTVYVMSSGYEPQDTAVAAALTGYGHKVVPGVQYWQFDGTQSLAGIDVVYVQANYNYSSPDMPGSGQSALVSYVSEGGGLVTTEWVYWDIAAYGWFSTLATILPGEPTTSYNRNPSYDLVQASPDPVVNSGLPESFSIPADDIAGCETNLTTRAGATDFYDSVLFGPRVGLCGWDCGTGRVASFSMVCGVNMLTDGFGGRLVSNTLDWASHGAGSFMIPVDTLTVKFGRLSSGSVADLQVIDGVTAEVCKFIVPNQQVAPITVEVGGTSPVTVPVSLVFRTFSRMSASGAFTMTQDLYDFTTSSFSATGSVIIPISSNYVSIAVAGDGDLARFLGPMNAVKARYRVRQVGPAAASLWCNEMDQAVWFVR